jgi:hypothetical protein
MRRDTTRTTGPTRNRTSSQGRNACASAYLSPKELAQRWRCSRSSVDRIARRHQLRRILLGEGRNGMVRYALEDVERLEGSRTV